jgi:hypothetical protein
MLIVALNLPAIRPMPPFLEDLRQLARRYSEPLTADPLALRVVNQAIMAITSRQKSRILSPRLNSIYWPRSCPIAAATPK